MKKLAKLFLGFSIAAIGVLWILNVTGVIGFDIFFRGWWTLYYSALHRTPDRPS